MRHSKLIIILNFLYSFCAYASLNTSGIDYKSPNRTQKELNIAELSKQVIVFEVAKIGSKPNRHCTGIFISRNQFLTNAHCFTDDKDIPENQKIDPIKVQNKLASSAGNKMIKIVKSQAGLQNITSKPGSISIHPGAKFKQVDNGRGGFPVVTDYDLAIVNLDTNVSSFSSIGNSYPSIDAAITAIGYKYPDKTDYKHTYFDDFKQNFSKIVPASIDLIKTKDYRPVRAFAQAAVAGQTLNKGDSGSPIFSNVETNPELVGIHSHDNETGFAAYVDLLAAETQSWINQTIASRNPTK